MIPGRGPAPMPLPRESALTARGQGSRGLEKEQLPGEMAVITASPQGTAPPNTPTATRTNVYVACTVDPRSAVRQPAE